MASFNFEISRRPVYLLITVFIPIMLLLFIKPGVFVLPYNSGERTSYSITLLLSFTVYVTMVSDNMPPSSFPVPKLSFFLFFCLMESMLVVFLNVLQLILYAKRDDQPVPKWLSFVINCLRIIRTSKQRGKNNETSVSPYGNEENNQNLGKVKRSSKYVRRLESADDIADSPEGNSSNKNKCEKITWNIVALTLDTFYSSIFGIIGTLVTILFITDIRV